MTTKSFLGRYAYVYMYILCFFLLCAAGIRSTAEAVSSNQAAPTGPVFVIDAGHGGIDSGTTSCTGIPEKELNLQIAKKMEKLLILMGWDTVLTRTGPDSIATEGETIRQQKQSDLRNRVAIADRYPGAVLISIHQNHYPDSRYRGPQVFYNQFEDSKLLASYVQNALNRTIHPSNPRTAKLSENVYLMNRISCAGVLIECGFVSNPEEEALLRQEDYQKKLCCTIVSALAEYMSKGTVL